LLYIIGHELGHIKSQHVLYHQMADALPVLSSMLSSVTLGLGGALSIGLELALLNWYRKSEFTADRAGLLACQNIDAATTVLMKLAGSPVKYYGSLNPEEFKKQAKEFEGFDENSLDKVAKVVSVMFADHPWTIMRAQELYKWIDSGAYDALLRGEVQEQQKQKNTSSKLTAIGENSDMFCVNCGYKFESDELFCPECGQKRNL
jgi:Zn-dependent protease with chaperone function